MKRYNIKFFSRRVHIKMILCIIITQFLTLSFMISLTNVIKCSNTDIHSTEVNDTNETNEISETNQNYSNQENGTSKLQEETTEPISEPTTEPITTEPIIEIETTIMDLDKLPLPVDYRIEVSMSDINLMARVVMSESGNQPLEGKIAVAEVIVNRVLSNKYANTVSGVVYQDGQFSTQNNGEPTNECYQAVYNALCTNIHPTNMYYFRGHHYHKWAIKYKKIGSHYFSLGNE